MSYKSSVGYKTLKNRTQVFLNFENDLQLNNIETSGKTMRESFYEFLETYPGKAIDFDVFCNKGYIYKNKFKGKEYTKTIKNSTLGHSQTKLKFAEILQQGRGDPSIISSDVLSSLEDVIYASNKKKKEDKLKLLKLEYNNVEFGRNLTWSYIDNNFASSFFENTDLKELPCVLGLPEHNSPRYILSHKYTNSKELLQPTAFDAGVDNILWRPGGKTLPLTGCSGRPRKDEVVHKPSVFNAIIEFEHNL